MLVARPSHNQTRIMDHADGSFFTTKWTDVVNARDPNSIIARRALDNLCRMYWYPIYCYVRRRGHPPSDAENLVQDFFIHLFARDLFSLAARSKGKLRGFIVSSLKFFLADERKRANAEKRGGKTEFVRLDLDGAEERFSAEPASEATAEASLDRAWATELLKRAIKSLGDAWRADGKGDLFDELKSYLLTTLDAAARERISARFKLDEGNVKVVMTRLRGGYRDAIRKEVAETVSSESEIDAEVAALRKAIES